MQRVVLELKILYANLDKTITDGVRQVGGYARHCGATEAHLVIFNRNPDVSWEEKIWHEVRHDAALQVEVWGA